MANLGSQIIGHRQPQQSPAGSPQGATVRISLAAWIANNQSGSSKSAICFWRTDHRLQAQRQVIIAFGTTGLLPEIDGAVANQHLTQDYLSERLANAGVLPMVRLSNPNALSVPQAPRRPMAA